MPGPKPSAPGIRHISSPVDAFLRADAGGELRLFPAWPLDGGRAAFRRLRAPGAFLVSAEWRRAGVVAAPVSILSEAGRRVAVRSPFSSAWLCVTAGGLPVPVVRGSGRRVFAWQTAAGTEYLLWPCDARTVA